MIEQKFLDKIEQLSHCTYSKITDIQKEICPMDRRINLIHTFEYWYEGYKHLMCESNTHLYFVGEQLPYRYDNKLKNTTFIDTLDNLVANDQIVPFLFFINGSAIPWSNITVIHDYHYTYLKISNVTSKILSSTAKMITFPFLTAVIRYGEDNDILTDSNRIGFYFDENGYLIENPEYQEVKIRFEILEKDIYYQKIDLKSYTNGLFQFPDLPYGYIPTLDNIFLFDIDGKYNIYNTSAYISNQYNGAYNLFKINSLDDRMKWAVLLYNTKNLSKSKSYLYSKSEDLSKDAILNLLESNKDIESSKKIWDNVIYPLVQVFDFNLQYGDSKEKRIQNIIQYITRYDFSLWKDAFIKNLNIKSLIYTGEEFEAKADDKGYVNLSRKHGTLVEDVALVFVNHRLYRYSLDILYVNNTIRIPTFGINNDDHVEIIIYTKCNNNILDILVEDENTPVYIHPDYDLKDCELMSSYSPDPSYEVSESEDDQKQYIVDFTYEELGNSRYIIHFTHNEYYGMKLKIVPKNQYRYYRFRKRDGEYQFKLPAQFNYCHDPYRYLVFVNGQKIDRSEYTITIMNPDRPFNQLVLYISTLLDEDDYLDVFYVPEPFVEKYKKQSIPPSGMILLEDIYNSNLEIDLTNSGAYIDSEDSQLLMLVDEEEKVEGDTLFVSATGYTDEGERINYPTTYPLSKYTTMVFVNGLKVNPLDIKDVSMDCMLVNVDKYKRNNDGTVIVDGEGQPITNPTYVDSLNNITIVEYVPGNKEIAGYLEGLYEQLFPDDEETEEEPEYDPERIDFNKPASDKWKDLIKNIIRRYSGLTPDMYYTGLQMLFGFIGELEESGQRSYTEDYSGTRSVLYDVVLDHYLSDEQATTGEPFVYDFENDQFDSSEEDSNTIIPLMPEQDKFADYDVE